MRHITPEDLFRFTLVGHLAVHPHRPEILYQERMADSDTNDYRSRIMRVTPDTPPRPFTAGPSDATPRFSPDGQWVAFLSKRSGRPQIWVMPTDGGEAHQLSFFTGGVKEFEWLPDSRALVGLALIGPEGIEDERRPEPDDPRRRYTRDVKVITEISHKLDGEGYYDEKRPHVVWIPLDPTVPPRQLTQGPMRHHGLAVSPDGRYLLTASRYGPDYDRQAFIRQIYGIDLQNPGEPRALTPEWLTVESFAFHPDGHRIYFLAQQVADLGYDNTSLYQTDWEGQEPVKVTPDWDRPWGDVALSDMPAPASNPLTFGSNGQTLTLLTSVNGTTQVAQVELATGQVTLLTEGPQVIYSFAVSPDETGVVFGITTPLNPGQIVWLSLPDRQRRVLADPNQEILRELTLAVPERFTAQAPDGPPVDGWVMPPLDARPGARYPAALEIHGGPMMMYAEAFFFEFQWLAANGYGVIYTNPRGSQGYGREFCRAILPRWGHLDYQDLMAALDTALARYEWTDSERLAVMGGSYGGYMTNWIISHTHRFRAAITMRSVVDWRTMVGTGDLGWHWIERAQNRWPWTDEDSWYREQSPITYVDQITTPLLIEHQEGDLRCPIEQAEILFTAMKYFNRAPVKFIRYPDEFHGMSRDGKPWHRIYRLDTFTEWLGAFLPSSDETNTEETSP